MANRMENIRFGRMMLDYMNNVVDEEKEQYLDSISLARCYCLLMQEMIRHDIIFSPHGFCFRWRLFIFLMDIIIERNDQKYLFVVNIHNYNRDDNEVVIQKMLLFCNCFRY